MNSTKNTKIAIIGIDCKFPAGSNSPDEFWDALVKKKDGIIPIPEDRWDHSYYYDPEGSKGKTFVDSAGFIDQVFDFSPTSFGMVEKEAPDIDPQQRLLIQSSWNCIQNAGYKISAIKESTGSFFGISYRDYYDFNVASEGASSATGDNMLGSSNAMAAGRVAYLLGLNGPAIQLDTICSSTLMTLHLACQSLQNGECDYALSGGANCILSPHGLIGLSQMGALSRSAKCQSFSKHADGYIRGEGVGVVLLKRLENAEHDGDYIYGVVEGTATNHDGRSNGLTAPNGKAHVKLMRSCLSNANLEPEDIGYVEAHGTGTYLGDPVELDALNQVFGSSKSKDAPLYIGSVKSNIGHLEPAAGVASLIKALLILKNDEIPAGLHLEELNPVFKWDEKPIVPVKDNMTWDSQEKYIGVSGFSMTGANAHVIVGSHQNKKTDSTKNQETPGKKWPILISAQNDSTLKKYATALLNGIDENTSISNLSLTLLTGREIYNSSIWAQFETAAELMQELRKFLDGDQCDFEKVFGTTKRAKRDIVLKIGDFSEFSIELFRSFSGKRQFAEATEKIDSIINKLLDQSLEDVISKVNLDSSSSIEKKITQFALAYIWTQSILDITDSIGLLDTRGDGDYLGAIFGEILSVEESLMLYLLEDGSKKAQLIDRIMFDEGNEIWKQSTRANNKEYWIKKSASDEVQIETLMEIIHKGIKTQIVFPFSVGPDFEENLNTFWMNCYLNNIRINWSQALGKRQYNKIALSSPPLATSTYVSDAYRINSQKNPDAIVKVNENASVSNRIASILHDQITHEETTKKTFVSIFSPGQNKLIEDHVVDGAYVFPGVGYISMICEALYYLENSYQMSLKNVQIFQPMVFDSLTEERNVWLDMNYDVEGEGKQLSNLGSWEIKSHTSDGEWMLHTKGRFEVDRINKTMGTFKPLLQVNESDLSSVNVKDFYDYTEKWGIKYGPEYQLIERLVSHDHSAKAVIKQENNKDSSSLFVSPQLLDAGMHAVFSAEVVKQFSESFLPSRYDEIQFYRPVQGSVDSIGSIKKVEKDIMGGELSYFDKEGNALVEIKYMESRRILKDDKEEEMYTYDEVWEEIVDYEDNDNENSDTEELLFSEELWFFADAQQAQQAQLIAATAHNNPPVIVSLANENEKDTSADISWIEDERDIFNIHEGIKTLFFFAPPVSDLSGLSKLFQHFQNILKTLPEGTRIRLCTFSGVAINLEENVNALQMALWGIARTIAIELKNSWYGVTDFSTIEQIDVLLSFEGRKTLLAYNQIAVRNKKFYTPVITPESFESFSLEESSRQSEADWANPVLITGGLGQMGRVFTENLVERGCRKIYLHSRNPEWLIAEGNKLERLDLSESQIKFRQFVKECKEKGIIIEPVAGRITHDEDMAQLAAYIRQQGVDKMNVIHTAGTVSTNTIFEVTTDELEKEWNIKYTGAILLDKHFRDFNVGFTLYTSSISTLWSAEGLTGYSSANFLLDGLAINRQFEGKRTLSARFGRFTERGLMKEHEARTSEASGILALSIEYAVDKSLELTEKSKVVIPSLMKMDWTLFVPLYQLMNNNRLLSRFETVENNLGYNAESTILREFDRPLKEIVIELVAKELEMEVDEVDLTTPLFEQGLGSVHSLSIRIELEKLMNIKLSVSLFYDNNTIELLSEHLEGLIEKENEKITAKTTATSEEDLLDQLMQELH